MPLYHLVYISTAYLPEMPEDELGAILHEATTRNAAEDITGMLLYSKGMFMQVLEGSEKSVLKIYDSIKKDRRHVAPRVLLSESTEKRSFSGWHMGFHWVRHDSMDVHDRLMPYLREDFEETRHVAKPDMALTLLQDFGKINQGKQNDLRM